MTNKTIMNEEQNNKKSNKEKCNIKNNELSHGERILIIETDVESFYEYALQQGLNTSQIRNCFSPVLGEIIYSNKRFKNAWVRSIIVLWLLLIGLVYFYIHSLTYEVIAVHGRLLLVKTFILWDWSDLYYRDCILYNPFYQPVDKSSDENYCKVCKTFKKIEKYNNIQAIKVDEHIYAHKPFVVTDATKGWPHDGDGRLLFNFEQVKKLFRDYPEIAEEDEDCLFYSSIHDVDELGKFAELIEENDLPNQFHIAWENCKTHVAKIYRKLAMRPYFFPSYAESTKRNQIVVANGRYDGELFELPQQAASATWIILLEGEFKISLIPVEHCRNCMKHYFSLTPGEGVLVPSSVWKLRYTSTSSNSTLAYASTLVWDAIE